MLAELLTQARYAKLPDDSPPWPGELDTAGWLWRGATPNYWQDQYDTGLDYADYLINPGVWGMTGLSYTTPPGALNTTSPGFTMGEGGRYDLRFEVTPSFGYRLWLGMMEPLAWARLLTDRLAARLDPEQALDSEIGRLGDWANVDRVAASGMPLPLLRRYTRFSRALEQVRGTDASAPVLGKILGAEVAVSWSSVPNVKVVSFFGQISVVARKFLRRHVPPHLVLELHAFAGIANYTGMAFTAKNVSANRTVPTASILSTTGSVRETVETL